MGTKVRKLCLVVCGLLVLGLLVSGCAPAAAPTPTSQPALTPTKAPLAPTPTGPPAATPAAEKPRYGGVLTDWSRYDFPSLDVHQESTGLIPEVVGRSYNGLIEYDPFEGETKVIPVLAEGWDISPDGLIYTFRLRKDVKWHDGQPFTSDDVKISLDRISNPPKGTVSPRQMSLAAIDKIETPDKNTVKVTLKYPSSAFLAQLANRGNVIMPKHIIDAKGNMKKDVVGTGPFKFKSFFQTVSFDVVKNEDYFIKGLPYLDGIKTYIILDTNAAFSAFRVGQVRLASSGLTPSQTEIVQKQMPNAEVIANKDGFWWSLYLNMKRPPFTDIRVRKAINLVIDRQQAMKVIEGGNGRIGASLPPMGQWTIPVADIEKMPGFRQPKDADRAEAKKLLAEAGYPTGFKSMYLLRSMTFFETAAVFLKDQLATIGIETELVTKETAGWFDTLLNKGYDMAANRNAVIIHEPAEFFSQYYLTGAPRNYGDFSDEQFEKLFEQQARALDPEKRKAVLIEMQKRLLELEAMPVLFWGDYLGAKWKDVRDYTPFGSYVGPKMDRVWLAK